MQLIANVLVLLVVTTLCNAIPRKDRDVEPNQNYFAKASRLLATNLLKDNIDIDGNHVHSPLGISTVLAVLAEGARGETYDEFMSALGFPSDKAMLRSAAYDVLKNFNSKDISTTPAFKIWFYIYKNNTVKDEFKQVLRDYYLAEVKDIDRSLYDWNEPQTNGPTNHNSKDIIEFETLKKSESFDDLQRDAIDDIVEKKEASKFDKVVDDKQYVEVPVIREEIAKEQEQQKQQQQQQQLQQEEAEEKVPANGDAPQLIEIKNDEVNDEDNETIRDDEKQEELKKDVEPAKPLESSEPERLSIPLKKLDDMEIMFTAESEFSPRRSGKGRTLLLKDDITSALSANSIVADDTDRLTRILLFNGLYFRGNWLNPFQELRRGSEDVFHLNRDESVPATMMRSSGKFRTAKLDDLDSQAIEFQYDDAEHSLLVIIPNDKEGLRNLVEKFKTDTLEAIKKQLASEQVSVCLPKFSIESTSRAEPTLKSLGLRKLFSAEDADLGDITEGFKLHVDEIVQHVNIRVDEGAISKDSLTAGAETRNLEEGRSILADRPFLYFVLHQNSNFVLVLGKIMSPNETQ